MSAGTLVNVLKKVRITAEVWSVALNTLCRLFSHRSLISQILIWQHTPDLTRTLTHSHTCEAMMSYQIDSWWSLQTRPPPARHSSPRGAHPPPSTTEHRVFKKKKRDFSGRVTARRGYIHQEERKRPEVQTQNKWPKFERTMWTQLQWRQRGRRAGGEPADISVEGEKQVCRRGLGVGALPPLNL